MGFYVPPLAFDIIQLIEKRIAEKPELSDALYNAVKTTGQKVMRITKGWQDSVCLAAEAVLAMTKYISDDAFKTLRFLVSASETPVDASKPISAFVLGILKKAGLVIPDNIINYQTQHACAAGTISIIQVASMIISSLKNSSAIVTTSDIARYEKNTTAEITQGSGAVALHICKNPRLIELDITQVGRFSADVDDFFRPLHSIAARVRGQYSMRCYNTAVVGALEDLAFQYNQSLEEVLLEADYIIFHVPFYTMPNIALKNILRKKLKYTVEDYDNFLQKKFIHDTAEPISYLGNTYTASTFFSLGGMMEKHYRAKKDICNKKVLIISYGSGSTSIVIKGVTTPRAPEVVSTWNLSEQLQKKQMASIDEYNTWVKGELSTGEKSAVNSLNARVYLSQLRQDDYRVYEVLANNVTKD